VNKGMQNAVTRTDPKEHGRHTTIMYANADEGQRKGFFGGWKAVICVVLSIKKS
jgi:hypothetical protein